MQFIFSTALDGKIKAWLYDNVGSRVDYDAPGRWCTTMAYSADGTRLTALLTCFFSLVSLFLVHDLINMILLSMPKTLLLWDKQRGRIVSG